MIDRQKMMKQSDSDSETRQNAGSTIVDGGWGGMRWNGKETKVILRRSRWNKGWR